MLPYLAILVIAAGAATWELTAEIGGEYFAMYVMETEDYGASKRDPEALNALAPPPVARKTLESGATPVLLAALTGDAGPKPVSPTAKPTNDDVVKGSAEKNGAAPGRTVVAAATKDADPTPKARASTPTMSTTIKSRHQAAEALMTLIGDTPHRQLNGTVFLPIAAQRVFGLRTALGEQTSTPVVTELPGRIVASPASSTLIQVGQDGYIETADRRFPFIGQTVKRGELLAYLEPSYDPLERAMVEEKIQGLINDIDLERKRMARLEEVIYVRYRTSKIEAIRIEIEGLKQRLATLRRSLEQKVELRAKTDGIVSRIAVHVGQFVHTGETVFEIVDPTQLWVAAGSDDPDLARNIAGASGITTDGRRVQLKYLGGGLTLGNQAVPLHFEVVDPVAGLTVDNPLTVVVQSKDGAISGVKVPRSSVLRTSEGQQVIWERRSAEVFVAYHVSPLPVDADSVLITGEIGPGTRVVSKGAAVLSQIR